MDAVALQEQMRTARSEADYYALQIELLLIEARHDKPTAELCARISDATRKYDTAMNRYKEASTQYYPNQ